MELSVRQIKEAALRLRYHEKQEVVEALIASFATGPEVEAAWDEVAERRWKEVEAGTVELIPAEEVMRELRRRFPPREEPYSEEEEARTGAFLANENEPFPDDEMILMARTRVQRRAFARGEPVPGKDFASYRIPESSRDSADPA